MDTWIQLLAWNSALAAALAIVIWLLGLTAWMAKRPALRHGLWMLVLVKLATPPLLPIPVWSPGVEESHVAHVPPSSATPVGVEESVPATGDTPWASVSIPRPTPDVRAVLDGPNPSNPPHSTATPFFAVVLVFWAAISILLLARNLWCVLRIRRAIERTEEADQRLVRITLEAATRLDIRNVRTRVVDGAVPPLVWVSRSGPIVLYPKSLVADLSDDRILGVACHELAHVARGDQWSNTFAMLLTATFWWHPAAWIAWREMHRAQEVCCDEVAVRSSGITRSSYLTTLLRAIDRSAASPVPVPASGFANQRSTRARFELVASGSVSPTTTRKSRVALLGLLLAMFCVPATRPSIADDTVGDDSAADDESVALQINDPEATGEAQPVVDVAKPLYLHWYVPNDGKPRHILTTAVVSSEPFECTVGNSKGGTIKLEGEIVLRDGRYTGRVDGHFLDFQRFSGEFVLERPVSPSLQSVVSFVLPPNRVSLSHERDFEKFIDPEEGTR